MATILETCRIPAAPGAASELSTPLIFLDIPWLQVNPIRRLLFYNFPCSKAYFLETVAPKLKESLSLTLRHYLLVAGDLIFYLNSEKVPEIRYVAPDSAVSLTIAESAGDFDDIIGNHVRDADRFYEFVPQIDPVTNESGYQRVPVMALKVTLFPGRGICVGVTNLHCLGDASSIVGFIQAWASISKLGGDEEFLTKQGESLPILDRSVIKDPRGINTIFLKVIKDDPLKSTYFPLPTNRVRATYILRHTDIQKLKDLVLEKKPNLGQVSSFVVTTSYVWTCFVKSGEQVDDDELEFFALIANIRARIDPPVPASYFGNCLGYGMAIIEHKQLVGEEGFVMAAEAIIDQIKNKLNKKDQVLKDAEHCVSDMKARNKIRALWVSGSRNSTCPMRILDGEGQESRKSCPLMKTSIPCLCASPQMEDWRLVFLCQRQEWKLLQLYLMMG
ncbi:UNVERIFIED_CONTAM: Malonyl-coenzyme:anthocyanin 5-O-glucoside-6'''-O-malonyltransferase [Sesamum latifolium]|uniref:Malonyl-coenzyme:anthocyanin 5-O-glucoside-6'''-O-malonyltransferase n=1 Tax=Sesamum latifolium TaxID=2727402 RepID=A0AAW2UFB7_9LAMI